MQSFNPTTGSVVARFTPHDENYVEARIAAANHAQAAWRDVPLEERTALLVRLANSLRQEKARFAGLITLEMGKPLKEAEAEIEKCAICCEHYASHAEGYLNAIEIPANATRSEVVFEPLGTILAVMPWNYPFWQFIRFAAPALAAGNAALLKHASNVPQSALALEEVFRNARAPEGLVSTLLIGSDKVERLIADPRIAAVTLTGSTGAGMAVAAQAGSHIKKQVLELGGSDPFIVLADADITKAAETAVRARFQNAGQSCIAAKRFIIEETVADAFATAFVSEARKIVLGDPSDPATTMGPMATTKLRDELHDQVLRTVSEGATLLFGGTLPEGPGAFYPPSILDHVNPQMAAFREETFGPLAAIVRARDAQHAITLANQSEFGLSAALWTADSTNAAKLARKIDAGAVFINGMTASDSRLPFGGIKRSGYGRELGAWGIREFTNTKTIWTGPAQ